MVQLILGKSGYGKTDYVFKSIKKLVDENCEVVLITPEQFSFVAKRRLLTELGEAKICKVQSLSFSSLNDEIKRLYGASELPVLSKGAKAVVMQRVALTVKDELMLYSNKVNQASFINSFSSVYDEMKSCRVSTDDINNASNDALSSGKRILSDKLRDIALLIDTYDNIIRDRFLDSADELTKLYNKLLQTEYFSGKTVFIDGFSGFVAQEYKIIEVIMSQANCTYITLCRDFSDSTDSNNLFYYVNKNYEILKGLADISGIEFSKPIILDKNYRANNEELEALEKYAYCSTKKPYTEKVENINLYSARSIYDECNNTASEIVKLLRNGYKASDITVICRDLDKYRRELEFSFDKYDVPYFNDERQNISKQPLIMFVNFLLRVSMYSKRSEDIFALLKTGITGLQDDDISLLENYVYLWSISGSKWNKEFTGSTKGLVDEITENDQKQIDEINISREYVISKINRFTRSVKGASCKDICKAVYDAVIDFECDNGIRELALKLDENGKSALANEQGRIWDLLMNILDKLALVGGEEEISVKEFYKMFNLMISNEDLGTIPTGLDNIQFGSADRIRCDNPRAVFILGANEGAFPLAVNGNGLLTEEDRLTLINNNFKLYSYSEILNAQEKYFAYMAMTCAKDKLYVSYLCDEAPSSIVTQITDIFTDISVKERALEPTIDSIESVGNAFEILSSEYNKNDVFTASLKKYFSSVEDYRARLEAVEKIVNNEDISIKSEEVATDLFKKNMYLSASKVEEYHNCAFRYFCKFGIGALPRKKAELDPMQAGTVIHYVLEQMLKAKDKNEFCTLTSKEIKDTVDEYLNQFLNQLSDNSEEFTPRLKYQFMRLSKILVRVIERLKEEFEHSDFEPKAFELAIGDGSNNEPVKSKVIKLEDGGEIKIKGSIDRVDTYTENGKQYVRVVDYKSNDKKFSLTDILYGINLQMFIYLFTLCQSDYELAGINAGVLYLKSNRKIFSYDKKSDASSIKNDEGKDFKMLGVVLNDDENQIAEHMEHSLQGKYIPVNLNSKNVLVGDIVTLEELGNISRKIDSLIAEMGINLHKGKINQNPIQLKNHRDPCEYCDYISVCKNRTEITPKVADAFKSDEVLRMLKEENENA